MTENMIRKGCTQHLNERKMHLRCIVGYAAREKSWWLIDTFAPGTLQTVSCLANKMYFGEVFLATCTQQRWISVPLGQIFGFQMFQICVFRLFWHFCCLLLYFRKTHQSCPLVQRTKKFMDMQQNVGDESVTLLLLFFFFYFNLKVTLPSDGIWNIYVCNTSKLLIFPHWIQWLKVMYSNCAAHGSTKSREAMWKIDSYWWIQKYLEVNIRLNFTRRHHISSMCYILRSC